MNYENHPQLARLAAEYVLGTMQPRVRRRLEAVMRRSPPVQAAVDAWSERLHLLSRVASPLDPSPAVFANIERRIDQSMPSKAAARRAPLWGWLRPAAGFAFGVLLTVAVTTLQWPVYETLTSAPPAAATPHHTVRLLFAPGTTVEQMSAALRTVDASIVAGPTPLGLLTVSVPDTQAPERALATLRAQPVVRFAEPVVAPKAAK
jgi:anti-sigma-K factor RskA